LNPARFGQYTATLTRPRVFQFSAVRILKGRFRSRSRRRSPVLGRGRRRAEVKRVSEILQLAVVIQRGGPSGYEFQFGQKLDFLFRGIAAEGGIFEELLQTWFHVERSFGLPFNKIKSLDVAKREPAVQENLDAKSLEVN